MPVTISIANQKGGVGKTTTAVNLSVALALCDKKVLLIDMDPQGNATSGLGIDKSSLGCSVYELLLREASFDEVVVLLNDSLHVLPSTLKLAGADVELVSALSRETRLAKALEGRLDYDYIIVDCPPSLGLLTINALACARGILIPIQCEFFALEGISQLLRVLDMVRNHLNSGLSIVGVVLTLYDSRLNLSLQVAGEIRNFFGDLVFDTVIPRNVKLAEAPSFGCSIFDYDSRSRGAVAYHDLAWEVLEREKKGFRSRIIGFAT